MKQKVPFNELINGDQPVLVDFSADWCGPCRAMHPILQDLAARVKGQAKIVKIDVDKNRELSMRYGVRGIPAFILFRNGEIKWRQSGMLSADRLKQVIDEFAN